MSVDSRHARTRLHDPSMPYDHPHDRADEGDAAVARDPIVWRHAGLLLARCETLLRQSDALSATSARLYARSLAASLRLADVKHRCASLRRSAPASVLPE